MYPPVNTITMTVCHQQNDSFTMCPTKFFAKALKSQHVVASITMDPKKLVTHWLSNPKPFYKTLVMINEWQLQFTFSI